jgi:hypothetical protein
MTWGILLTSPNSGESFDIPIFHYILKFVAFAFFNDYS